MLTGVGGLAGRGLTACLSAGSSLASVCTRLIWLRRRFLFVDGRDQLAVVCLSVFLACVWLLLWGLGSILLMHGLSNSRLGAVGIIR